MYTVFVLIILTSPIKPNENERNIFISNCLTGVITDKRLSFADHRSSTSSEKLLLYQTFRVINSAAPSYLSPLIQIYSPPLPLHSDKLQTVVFLPHLNVAVTHITALFSSFVMFLICWEEVLTLNTVRSTVRSVSTDLWVVRVAGLWTPPHLLGFHPVALHCGVMFTGIKENWMLTSVEQGVTNIFHTNIIIFLFLLYNSVWEQTPQTYISL